MHVRAQRPMPQSRGFSNYVCNINKQGEDVKGNAFCIFLYIFQITPLIQGLPHHDCYYEIQRRYMSEIKLVLHKDDSLPDEIKNRLDSVRSQLTRKKNTDWVWSSACKTKTITDSFFEQHDINDDSLDKALTKSLDSALNKCQSAILEKIR